MQWLYAGRVGRPHGLDGSFHVTRPNVQLLENADTVVVGDLDVIGKDLEQLGFGEPVVLSADSV